jgi:hypothetical protein
MSIDSNFRLLREDAVSSMRENIAQTTHDAWKNARIIGLDLGKRGSMAAVSFVIRFDYKTPGSPNWKRSRALMPNSVVAFVSRKNSVQIGDYCSS